MMLLQYATLSAKCGTEYHLCENSTLGYLCYPTWTYSWTPCTVETWGI